MNVPTVPPGSHRILRKILTITLAILGIAFILWLDRWFTAYVDLTKFNEHLSVGLLVLIGFLTGFHCVGMCGPLILSYATKNARAGYQSHFAHLLYGVGKTVSYTTIGGLLGAFGAIVAFTPFTRGAVGVAAGIFLILFGLHMLQVFPALSHFQFRTPGFVMRFIGKEYRKHSNPFVIGLLNGLMIICGPLQAMYVMAAGTGSWLEGAKILFFFGIGTLPLLLGFGFLTSLLSNNLTPKLLKVSGAFIIILGVLMINRGVALTGIGVDFHTLVVRVSQQLFPLVEQPFSIGKEQTITMDVTKTGYSPNQFTLHKGVPVKWIINAKELTDCNKVIVVPQYGLEIKLQPGVQVIEFTPAESGEVVVPWSCWMGMIHGTFIIPKNPPTQSINQTSAAPAVDSNKATEENYQQHLLHELNDQWQRAKSFFSGI
ncbi:MAG: sulfite exporter TauE/SafE family protein [Methylococcaceae bacterium]|nr:sulfite exporter TauE/SafE family protein [Methylococcaceae bacterium]